LEKPLFTVVCNLAHLLDFEAMWDAKARHGLQCYRRTLAWATV